MLQRDAPATEMQPISTVRSELRFYQIRAISVDTKLYDLFETDSLVLRGLSLAMASMPNAVIIISTDTSEPSCVALALLQ